MIDTIVLCGNTRDVEGAGFFQMILADVSADPDDPKDPQAAEEQLEWIERQLNESKADYLFVAGHYPIYSIADHGPMKCPLEKVNPLLKKYKVSAYFAGHDHTLQHLMVKNDDSPLESDRVVKNDDSPLEGEIMIKHDDSPLEAEMLLQDETEPSIMHYIVSGAGSRTDRSRKHENDVPAGSLLYSYPTGFNPFSQLGFSNGGFVFAEISNESAVFKFFNGLNEQKYECSIPPRTFH